MCFFSWTSIFSSSWVFTSYLFPMCDFDETKQATLSWSEVNETFFFKLLYINKKIDGKTEKKTIGDCKWNSYFDTHLFLASYCLKTLWRELHSMEKKYYVIENLDNETVLLTGHHSFLCEKRKKLLEELVQLLFQCSCCGSSIAIPSLFFFVCYVSIRK